MAAWSSIVWCISRITSSKGNDLVSGTKDGGKATAATNKQKYGEDFYKRIGAEGGKKGKTGGFYKNRELARIAGAKGGRVTKKDYKRNEKS